MTFDIRSLLNNPVAAAITVTIFWSVGMMSTTNANLIQFIINFWVVVFAALLFTLVGASLFRRFGFIGTWGGAAAGIFVYLIVEKYVLGLLWGI